MDSPWAEARVAAHLAQHVELRLAVPREPDAARPPRARAADLRRRGGADGGGGGRLPLVKGSAGNHAGKDRENGQQRYVCIHGGGGSATVGGDTLNKLA